MNVADVLTNRKMIGRDFKIFSISQERKQWNSRMGVVDISGVFRISKKGECSLATSAHTKGGKPSFPIFLLCKKHFAKGAMADLAKGRAALRHVQSVQLHRGPRKSRGPRGLKNLKNLGIGNIKKTFSYWLTDILLIFYTLYIVNERLRTKY